MDIRPTAWFPLDRHTPVRDGWYEVQLERVRHFC